MSLTRRQIGAAWTFFPNSTGTTIPLPAREIRRGSLVKAVFRYETENVALTVTDSAGGVWRVERNFQTNVNIAIAWCWNHPGGANVVITGNLASSQSYRYGCAWEETGGDVADPAIPESIIKTYGNAATGLAHWVGSDPLADTVHASGSFNGTTPTALQSLIASSSYFIASCIRGQNLTRRFARHSFTGSGTSIAHLSIAFRAPEAEYVALAKRRIWVPVSTGGSVGNASGSLSSITTTAAAAGASGAAQSTAALESLSVTPAAASASGAAAAAGAAASLSLVPAQATATGVASAAASLAAVSTTPASATASCGAAIVGNASASLAALSMSASQASASGSAAASSALAGIDLEPASAAASGGASVPATASASLASLSTSPATATASGAATAAGSMLGMNLTPAQAQATAAAWAAAELRALSVTPATARAGEPPAIWPASAAAAIVPTADVRAIALAVDHIATVPASGFRAIAPATGDDMQPIKTFEQYKQDREVYEIDFDAKYLAQANDTAAMLKAIGSDAGVTVTPEVSVGGALSSGVVRVAVDDPAAAGDYKVWAQIATAAGRERTGVIVVRVEDL